MTIDEAMQLAIQQHQAGRLPEAQKIYRQVLEAQPENLDALNLLGVVHTQIGDQDAAIDFLRRAIEINPAFAEGHRNLGVALGKLNRPDEAIAAYSRAIALGGDDADAFNDRGLAFAELGRFDEAIADLRRAIALRPDFGAAHTNLGNALKNIGDLDQSLIFLRRAVALEPGNVLALNNLGCGLSDHGEFDPAIACFERAIALQPDLPDPHWNLSHELLRHGDFHRGWREYEWRLKIPRKNSRRDFSQTRWDGSDLCGRTVFIYSEQGLGDAIQFVRYAPLVADRGGRVLFETPPELAELLSNCPGIAQIVPKGSPPRDFQASIPLLSLPMIFDTQLNSIPANVPFIAPPAPKSQEWAQRLGAAVARARIGLVWAGRPSHGKDRHRSIPLADFAPMGHLKNLEFHSLQKGRAAGQAHPAGLKLMDWNDNLIDFADTAALIQNLNLIVSVDTAVAHLEGAMGKPVWTLLPFVPDWRWMLDRNDTPWYPTMRLVRQKTPGDWAGVIQTVARELSTRFA